MNGLCRIRTLSIIHLYGRYKKKEVTDGIWIDPFANQNKWATITNDLNPAYDTDYHLDALEFLKLMKRKVVNGELKVKGVLFDPPYSPRQIKESYESVGLKVSKEQTQSSFWSKMKKKIAVLLSPGGKAICFGWNSQGIGKKRGFEMSRVLIVAHGGMHNDTICTVETKL